MGISSLKLIQQQIHKIWGRDLSARASRAGMWTLYFIGIGIIAGVGAIIFHYLCQVGIHIFYGCDGRISTTGSGR
jgi:hypothetical protein